MSRSRVGSPATAPAPQEIARVLTWGADEKVLLALTAAGWLGSRGLLRRAGNHALPATVAALLLPHVLKVFLDQTCPDRRMVIGRVQGALTSDAGALSDGSRRTIRTLVAGLSLTRTVVLQTTSSRRLVLSSNGSLRLLTGYPSSIGRPG
jgi:hypothetical protein